MKLFAYISSDSGDLDLEAPTLDLLAQSLPETWRGTARAYDCSGKLIGFTGRNSDGLAWSMK